MTFELTGTYTDFYQLTMGQVYFLNGIHEVPATFDYFFRKLPFEGGYALFAGLDDALDILERFRFSEEDIAYLKTQGFGDEYLNYLRDFRFRGTVYASREGDLIFPTRPILWVSGSLIEAQLVETALLNILNFQSLIATKTSRMRQVAGQKALVDFGLRRAQGLGGYHASRAAMIGGCNGTSNVLVARDYSMDSSGTMAHAFIQCHDDELTAFRQFAEGRPDHCTVLVDTYNTLESGVPNAIIVAKEMEQRGQRMQGVRLDSGDLAYLSKRARHMLDEAGLSYIKITASNQLDEYVIKSLEEQGAPIDAYGVGTNLVTGVPDAALDGVYKLSYFQGKPRIKVSDSLKKVTLPHQKQVYRLYTDTDEIFGADAVTLFDEPGVDHMYHPFEPYRELSLKGLTAKPQLHKVMENGQRLFENQSLAILADHCSTQIAQLPAEYKRFQNSHIYKVGISKPLKELRDSMKMLR